MMRRRVLVAGLAMMVTVAPVLAAKPPANWHRDITAPDRKRLSRLWDAWTRALAEVNAGQASTMQALGPVAVPDASTMNAATADGAVERKAGPLPAPGAYRCRTIKLGQREGTRPAAMIETAALLPCTISARGDGLWFEQGKGPQRLGGRLYPDGDRLVFLGSTALAGEMAIMPYGADPDRDAVGALRAIGDQRWRLELPWPNWQSNLGIIEILPG